MSRNQRMQFKWLIRVLVLAVLPCMLLAAIPIPAFATTASQPCIQTDRWMEIDLYWFKQHDQAGSVSQFWDRFLPLFDGVCGYRGVILNVGWTVGPVMEWSGDLDQRISLPTGSGESQWVDEHEMLTGTTAQREKLFEERFASPVVIKRRGYDPWTYGDVKLLSAALKAEAARVGIRDFKVGILNYAWTHAYGEEAAWVKRHPEAFANSSFHQKGCFDVGRYFDPGARLHADTRPLGGLPGGIPEGMPVHRAYAAQWGSLSHAVGLDAIMLRDSFGLPLPYQRGGPWGLVAPSPAVIHKATQDVEDLVRETKQANPVALVMMYSSGASAIADWRSNGLDLEAVARQGYLDIWVDQTWAGAWNEVGVRDHAFWNAPGEGMDLSACLHAYSCRHPRGHQGSTLLAGRNLRCVGELGCDSHRTGKTAMGHLGIFPCGREDASRIKRFQRGATSRGLTRAIACSVRTMSDSSPQISMPRWPTLIV